MSTAGPLPGTDAPLSAGTPPLRLEVEGLSTSFLTDRGRVHSVSDVSFSIPSGSTLALVGESGSGKSVTSLSLMGLHARDAHPQVGGRATFLRRDGRSVDLLSLNEKALRALRGNELAMIFQEPMTSLNPLLTVGRQIAESARLHLGHDGRQALAHAQRMLELVEIPAAARRVNEYPHELSGGMRQRVMIALAMACSPTLLIADEPTTALDVTIQAQILALIGRLRDETGMSVLFITHNLGVVAQYADAVAVMYAGRIVEAGPVGRVFARPAHPYTRALLDCLPAMARKRGDVEVGGRRRLDAIPGQVSSPFDMPPGCAFRPRCRLADAGCDAAVPALRRLARDGGHVRCFKAEGVRS